MLYVFYFKNTVIFFPKNHKIYILTALNESIRFSVYDLEEHQWQYHYKNRKSLKESMKSLIATSGRKSDGEYSIENTKLHFIYKLKPYTYTYHTVILVSGYFV